MTATLRRFWTDESGVALVEFAIALPLLVLLFGVTVESYRLMITYQATISGVRDATRYLARVTPTTICPGGNVAGLTATLEDIVRNRITGASVFPTGVTLTSVTPTLACVSGGYRVDPAPVATVTARVRFTYPFGALIDFGGGSTGTFTAVVTDQARIFGS
jgi:Flp pilus assembly protein TadG